MNESEPRKFELPTRKSLTSIIFDQLEEMILEGKLKPGEAINEKALSDNNGFSRAPIREACRRLEQAGLIEIIVNRGAYVKQISQKTASELCELRIVLALHACREAAGKMTAAKINKLIKQVEKVEAAATDKNLTKFYKFNTEFHMMIMETSANSRLCEIYIAINKELNLFRWRALKVAPQLSEALMAHRAIVKALQDNDIEKFLKTVQAHLQSANDRLLAAGIEH